MPGRLPRAGEIGYLPQDPKAGDLDVLARDRVLSARGLDVLLTDLEKQQALMAEYSDEDERDPAPSAAAVSRGAIRRAGRPWRRKLAGRTCASLGLPGAGADLQRLRTLSGGQRRRVELARRILSAASEWRWKFHHLAARRADQPPSTRWDSLGWLRTSCACIRASCRSSPQRGPGGRCRQCAWFLDAVRGWYR